MGNLVAVLKGKANCGGTKFELQTKSAYIASQMRMFTKEITDNSMRKNLKLKELNIDLERARRNYEQVMNMRSMYSRGGEGQSFTYTSKNKDHVTGQFGTSIAGEDISASIYFDDVHSSDSEPSMSLGLGELCDDLAMEPGDVSTLDDDNFNNALVKVKEQLRIADMKAQMKKFEIESEAAAREAELQQENRCLDSEKSAIDTQLELIKAQEQTFNQSVPEMAREGAPKF